MNVQFSEITPATTAARVAPSIFCQRTSGKRVDTRNFLARSLKNGFLRPSLDLLFSTIISILPLASIFFFHLLFFFSLIFFSPCHPPKLRIYPFVHRFTQPPPPPPPYLGYFSYPLPHHRLHNISPSSTTNSVSKFERKSSVPVQRMFLQIKRLSRCSQLFYPSKIPSIFLSLILIFLLFYTYDFMNLCSSSITQSVYIRTFIRFLRNSEDCF